MPCPSYPYPIATPEEAYWRARAEGDTMPRCRRFLDDAQTRRFGPSGWYHEYPAIRLQKPKQFPMRAEKTRTATPAVFGPKRQAEKTRTATPAVFRRADEAHVPNRMPRIGLDRRVTPVLVGSPCRAGECRSSACTAHQTREWSWRLSSSENEWGTDRGCDACLCSRVFAPLSLLPVFAPLLPRVRL
jgi:hypothetical protein